MSGRNHCVQCAALIPAADVLCATCNAEHDRLHDQARADLLRLRAEANQREIFGTPEVA